MIIIKVKDNTKRFINKCMQNNINIYNIEYYKDYLLATINEADLKQIKKLNYYSKIKVYKVLGKKRVIKNIKDNLYNILLLIAFLLLIYLISNVIIEIEIKHESKTMIKRIDELLKHSLSIKVIMN